MRVNFTHIAIFDTLTVENYLKSHPHISISAFSEAWLIKALKLSADAIIIRDSAKEENLFTQALLYLSTNKPSEIPLICNHRSQLMLQGANGIHYKRGGKRNKSDAAFLAGISAHSSEGVQNAERNGFDYVFVSPVFETNSHPGEKGIGLEKFSRICVSVRIPVFALGGITEKNRAACFVAGAKGTASISLFMPD